LQCPKKQSEQLAVQMCANNLDPQIATYTGNIESQNFDSIEYKVSNVERQLPIRKVHKPKRGETKGQLIKENSWPSSLKQAHN